MHHMTRAGFNETEEKEFTVMPVNLELFSETMEVIPVVNKARQLLNWDEFMNTSFFYPKRQYSTIFHENNTKIVL